MDDTIVLDLITNGNERDYRSEVQHLASWCDSNNLALNIKKTKEMIADFRKKHPTDHRPLSIGSEMVESVNTFKFLGVTMVEDLTWGPATLALPEEAKELPHPQTTTGELLQLHHQQCSDIWVPGVVLQLLQSRPAGTPAHGENSRENNCIASARGQYHLHHALLMESAEHPA